MKKRLGTFISALLFCLLCLPGVCLAAEFTAGNLKYNTTGDDTVEVVGMVNPLPEPGELVIPAKVTYDSKEYTVTAIGREAFSGTNANYTKAKSIKTIQFPDTLIRIEKNAFWRCENLTGELIIPDSVKYIGDNAFQSFIQKDWEPFDIQSNHITSVKLPANLQYLGSYAFAACTELKSVEIPAGIETLNSGIFRYCFSLEEVTLNEGLKETGQETFSYCYALKEINFPNSLETIGIRSFEKAGLTKITCPENLITIKRGAFVSCASLQEVLLNENLQTIESNAFQNSGIVEITVPASIPNVAASAFRECTGTIKVYTPQLYADLVNYKITSPESTYTVELIGSLQNIEFDDGDYHFIIIDADKNEVQLTGMSESYKQANGDVKPSGSLTIPSQANGYGKTYTVTSIGVSAFNDCVDLTDINLPETLNNIGQDAFRNCNSLNKIELPDNIKTIGSFAFVSCDNLSEIKWPANLESIGYGTFQTCPITTLQLPNKLQQIGETAFLNCQELQNAVLPESLQSIGQEAFKGCAKLETINLPENLNTMGNSVFQFCSHLKTVTFSQNFKLTELPSYTFASCTSLDNVELPASISKISVQAFTNCTSLKNINLPENLTTLDLGVFWGCTNFAGQNGFLQLPESVTTLDRQVFYDCPNIERIYIPGSNLQNLSPEAFAGVPLVTCDTKEMLVWLTDRAGANTKVRLQNYPINVASQPAEGGAAAASAAKAAIGDAVTLTATANAEWQFEKWQPENPELVITDNSFTMPDYAVNILAIFKKIVKPKPEEPTPEEPTPPGPPQPSVYTITFDTDGGVLAQGTPNPDSATSGQEYKMPAANKSGHTLKHWAIGGKTSNITANPGDVYTFTADTWVYAIWQPDNTNQPSGGGDGRRPSQTKPTETIKPTEPTQPDKPNTGNADNISSIFQDLQPGAWYTEAIAYVYALGLMQGVAEGEFAPNANLSRAMLAQIIYNMAGQPETSANSSFADVADNVWYSKAISWANAQGVVTGYSAAEFAPNAEITREQMIVMLWRYAGQPATSWQQADFPDWPQSSAYARQAICWAAECGLIKGHSDGTLRPQATATRAEAAQVLQNYLTKISK